VVTSLGLFMAALFKLEYRRTKYRNSFDQYPQEKSLFYLLKIVYERDSLQVTSHIGLIHYIGNLLRMTDFNYYVLTPRLPAKIQNPRHTSRTNSWKNVAKKSWRNVLCWFECQTPLPQFHSETLGALTFTPEENRCRRNKKRLFAIGDELISEIEAADFVTVFSTYVQLWSPSNAESLLWLYCSPGRTF